VHSDGDVESLVKFHSPSARSTGRITGDWGEKGWETGNAEAQTNAQKRVESQPSGARLVRHF
jgi:hypothetical protein